MRKIFSGIVLCLLAATTWADAPKWIADPANSKWIVFGGPSGVLEQNGLKFRASSEGKLEPVADINNTPCVRVVSSNPGSGLCYLEAQPWPEFSQWLGDGHQVLFTVRYFLHDSKGSLGIQYDSSDLRLKDTAGVWRTPEGWKGNPTDAVAKSFVTATVRLPYAYFTKRCNGGDIRITSNFPELVLAGVALTRVTAVPDETLTDKLFVQMDKVDGATTTGTGARFPGVFAQNSDEPLRLEAECATELSIQQAPGYDRSAFGGGYIHYVDSARWKFTVKTPGRYTAWERALFPTPGNWNHNESMDGASGVYVQDQSGKSMGWVWVKGGTYDLAAGEHVFEMAYLGGARLDVVILSRDGVKAPGPDADKLASSFIGPVRAMALSNQLKPFDVAAWESVSFNSVGLQKTELSQDAGKTWSEFDPAAGLSKLAVKGNGQDSLSFRLTLEGNPGNPPFLAGGEVQYRSGPNNSRIAENSRLRLELDSYGIVSLRDKRTGVDFCKSGPLHEPLAKILIKPVGATAPVSLDFYGAVVESFQVDTPTPDTTVMTMTHRFSNGLKTTVEAKLLPSAQIEWRLQIDNPTAFEVAKITFPILPDFRIGDSQDNDHCFIPEVWNHGNMSPPRPLRHIQPSMRWMAHWDDQVGYYMGIEDAQENDFNFVQAESSGVGRLNLGSELWCRVKSGATWTSPVFRHAVTGADWHEGADLYREFVGRTLKTCDYPDHVKWLLDAWETLNANAFPSKGWGLFQSDYDLGRPNGVYFMATNRQMTDGPYAFVGMFPYPSPAWGSEREFSQQLHALQARGGMLVPYLNYHRFVPGFCHYPRIGWFPKSKLPKDIPIPDEAWMMEAGPRSFIGGNYNFQDPTNEIEPMAHQSAAWRNWILYWSKRMNQWGMDGMYYDQCNLSGSKGWLYPGYDDSYGSSLRARRDLLRQVRDDNHRDNPYFTLAGEGVHDVISQNLDLPMTSSIFPNLDIYLYCNPGAILLDGSWNGAYNWTGKFERMRAIWQVGARFEHMVTRDNQQGIDDFGQQILRLRRAVKCLIYDGVFRDTVGLKIKDKDGSTIGPEPMSPMPVRGVFGRWFRIDKDGQRGAVINMINLVSSPDSPAPGKIKDKWINLPETAKPKPVAGAVASICTKEFGPVKAAVAWTLEGETIILDGKQEGDYYSFPVPESEMSTVVLSNKLAPVVEWGMDNVAAIGMTSDLKLKITNVDSGPLGGVLELLPPKGWPAGKALSFSPIEMGKRVELTVPVTVPEDFKNGRYDIRCRVKTDMGSFTTYNFMAVNDPVLVEFRGDPGTYHLWYKNLTDKPFVAKQRVSFSPAGLSVVVAEDADIPPLAEVKVQVLVKGQEKLAEISDMEVTTSLRAKDASWFRIMSKGKELQLVRGIIPAVSNGGFEQDSANDHTPDWWICYEQFVGGGARDQYGIAQDRMSLDDKNPHSGKNCLRIDGVGEGVALHRASMANGTLVNGARYRVSVWIRTKATDGVMVQYAGQTLGKGKTGGDEWKNFTGEFIGKSYYGDRSPAWLVNTSKEPAYFDDLVVEELAPAQNLTP